MKRSYKSRIIFFVGTVLLISGCALRSDDADQVFTKLATQLWLAEQKLTEPEPGKLLDMSPDALAKRQQQRLAWQTKLQQLDVTKLSEQNQINHAILSLVPITCH